MGKLVYGGHAVEIEFDDRALLHLQIVIANKLRPGRKLHVYLAERSRSG